jgi:hypothetical protein
LRSIDQVDRKYREARLERVGNLGTLIVSMTGSESSAVGIEELRVIRATNAWVLGEYNRCMMLIWRGAAVEEPLQLRIPEMISLGERFSQRCCFIEIMEPTSRPPPDSLRALAMKPYTALGGNLSGIAIVFEGTNLRAGFGRAVIAGMTFLLPQLQPTKVFKHLEPMAEWVSIRVQEDRPNFRTDLIAAIQQLRKKMDEATD